MSQIRGISQWTLTKRIDSDPQRNVGPHTGGQNSNPTRNPGRLKSWEHAFPVLPFGSLFSSLPSYSFETLEIVTGRLLMITQ